MVIGKKFKSFASEGSRKRVLFSLAKCADRIVSRAARVHLEGGRLLLDELRNLSNFYRPQSGLLNWTVQAE